MKTQKGEHKMKKFFVAILSMLLIFTLTACGDSSDSKSEEGRLLTEEEFQEMYSNPDEFIGDQVDFYAKIFVTPERDADGTYIQAYVDNDMDKNIIIGIEDPNLDVSMDDIIHIIGTVKGSFEGENAFGGTVTAPSILASSIEVTDYATAFAPAIKTIEVSQEKAQHDVVITVEKIEIAETETRVYARVKNNSEYTYNFYTWSSKATIGSTQYEVQDNWEAGYPEISSTILSGVESSGIITFPKFEGDSVTLHLDGISDNFELDFDAFVFDINLD